MKEKFIKKILVFMLPKSNFNTGSGEENQKSNTEDSTKKITLGEQANNIVNAFGGRENITSLEACSTRLFVKTKDENVVDEQALKDNKAIGVLKKDGIIQVVFGPKVSVIKEELDKLM
ncbi:glucose PTS transporter subunit EIIB [Caviibacter abscessus]|uniref:glucose PTS transporter subunit EIIB n=1 Tax=Caviibacter abscessus TaxID=1766719 RepID=UPI00083064A5|nr:PTS glucose/sucrose transporter subunit IIB [Caviibacter abscessus]